MIHPIPSTTAKVSEQVNRKCPLGTWQNISQPNSPPTKISWFR